MRIEDLARSLRQGLSNFARAPLYGLFFGGVYAVGGWLILALVFLLDLHPFAAGFARAGARGRPVLGHASWALYRRAIA